MASKQKPFLLAITILIGAVGGANAEIKGRSDIAECSVSDATAQEIRLQASDEARLLEHQREVIGKLQKLVDSRKWKSGVPLGDQMNPTEANEFGNLQEQAKIGVLSIMYDSKRTRDIRVFARMAHIADLMDDPNYVPPADTDGEEFLLYGIIETVRDIFPVSDQELYDATTNGSCSLEQALLGEALRVIRAPQKLAKFFQIKKQIDALVVKYGQPLDPQRMTTEDQKILAAAQMTMSQYKKMLQHAKDFIFVSKIESVSKLQLAARRQSQYESPGNIDHFDVVWNSWKSSERVSAEQDKLSGVLNLINEKIPSDFAKSGN